MPSRDKEKTPVRGEIAVVGLGRWGGGPVLKTLSQHFPETRLHGFARSNYGLWQDRTDLPANVRIHRAADFQGRVLDREDVNIVIVTSSLSSHFDLAKAALGAGKDVLVEKPIAKTKEEAAVLVSLAHRQKRILAVGYELMYDPRLALLKTLVSKGPFEKIQAVTLKLLNPLRGRRLDPGTNGVEDLVPHLLSILHVLAGKRAVSHLAVEASRTHTQATIRFHYEGIEVALHIDCDYKEGQKTRTVQVIGSEAVIDVDFIKQGILIKDKAGHILDRHDARYPPVLAHRHRDRSTLLACEFSDFFKSVLTRRPPRNSADLTDWIPEAMDRMHRA